MVAYKTLKELLDINDSKEKTNQLRRAFSAYSQPVDITGFENPALIVFLNLTYKRVLVEDLCDEALAKKTLHDETHFEKCISEIEWLHSHNLKYPDIKVSKQRLLVPNPAVIPSVISSANCQRMLGWSHNSATINCAKLFGCHFYWQGKIVCLANLMVSENVEFKKSFKNLGMTFSDYDRLCLRIKKLLPETSIPNHVDRFSKQVQLPYHDKYISVTPVVSHSLQAEIQKNAINNEGRYTNIEHERSSSIGDLPASLGGNIAAFYYPPKISSTQANFTESMLWRLKQGKDVFKNKILSSERFTHALSSLILSSKKITHKQ